MTMPLVKNLAAGVSATAHMAYFSPKPRMLKTTTLLPEGTDRYRALSAAVGTGPLGFG
jgi:hypothetical protein